MKTRGIIFLLEWILANSLVLKVLDDTYSFHFIPWVLWNITFGIFLFKLFTAPEDDGSVWPIGPTVGAFGFVLTATRVQEIDNDAAAVAPGGASLNTWLSCFICVFGFVLVGISSDVLGDEWRDAPPPDGSSSTTDETEKSKLLKESPKSRSLVTTGPYGIVRHPIYTGLLLEAFGSNVADGFSSWIALVALVSVTAAYVVQLHQEERELNKLSGGEYDRDYKPTTRYKLIPFVF